MKFQIFSILFCLTMALNSHCEILNSAHLNPFFEKLAQLETDTTGRKINIVHIGDSHIQNNFLGNAIRKTLQQTFGNGGYGFTFPYGLFRGDTSIGDAIHYFSNVPWRICRNNMPRRCAPGADFGLCGYGFTTSINEFALKIEIVDERYKFNTIKVVSAGIPFPFSPAMSIGNLVMKNPPSSLERHKVRRGETLATIAKKYGVSADSIKDRNNMTSNAVRVGKELYIPVEVEALDIDMTRFNPIEFQHNEHHVATYWQKEPASEMYLIPAVKRPLYNLSGIVLENDNRGVIYHGIGTVGSMALHFNRTPLFFEQLPVLSPDLVIVSFGTNESHSRVSTGNFIEQIKLLISNIRKFNPNVPILVTTQPTSLFRGRKLNTFAKEYNDATMRIMQKDDFAVWDLYSYTGGLMGVIEKPKVIQIGPDRMHYTKQGYINQGIELANLILQDYKMYKQSRKQDD
jgi:LysM repeat protein